MPAHFRLSLDTAPPAAPALVIDGGAARTGAQNVAVDLSTSDYEGGARDVQEARVWGDVDPGADPKVQPTEEASLWHVYQPSLVVRLSPGDGRKRLYARLRDDVCNETVVFTDFIDLDTSVPVVSITTPVDRGRVSKVAPCSRALFVWEASVPFAAYEVRVVPSVGSPHVGGVPIPTTSGSANTQGVGSFPAETGIATVVEGADLEAASPGDTEKIVKVFVRAADGTWSA